MIQGSCEASNEHHQLAALRAPTPAQTFLLGLMMHPSWCNDICISVPLQGESNGQVDSPHKWPVMQSVDVFFVPSLNNLLKKTIELPVI